MNVCENVKINPNLPAIEDDANEEYYNSLQRYSTLYRILLSRPYSTEVQLNQWNRIDIKIVNELGLTLTGAQKSNCWLQVDCQLIVERNGEFTESYHHCIKCRPVQHDAWEFNSNSDIAGFFYSTDGDFEYIISTIDEGILLDNNDNYYIQIYPTCKPLQLIQAFPLVIGPIKVIESELANGMIKSEWSGEDIIVSKSIFHAYSIPDKSFLMIKEKWELGTPGKMWDSALVISQMLADRIKSDPSGFKEQRILDLSAGTGCVGLLVALLYKKIYNQSIANLPQITMTDLPEALDLIYQNRATNQLEGYTDIDTLTWGDYADVQRVLLKGPINTIVASDVLYEPTSFSKLVQTLDWLSSDSPSHKIDIFLGYKRRGLNLKDEESFFEICAKKFEIRLLNTQAENKLITNEGWIVNGGFSNIFKETGVNVYQLVRK